jgi:hypothetical protein
MRAEGLRAFGAGFARPRDLDGMSVFPFNSPFGTAIEREANGLPAEALPDFCLVLITGGAVAFSSVSSVFSIERSLESEDNAMDA